MNSDVPVIINFNAIAFLYPQNLVNIFLATSILLNILYASVYKIAFPIAVAF